MGYDPDECLDCYVSGGGNNPCSNEGSHVETCLTCIDELCGSTTSRVTYALTKFDWDPNGRCTNCNKSGITIAILLCTDCTSGRKFLTETVPSDNNYDCSLCDYEGECNYDCNTESLNWYPYCDDCTTEITSLLTKRTIGIPEVWSGNGYIGLCIRCNLCDPVEELLLCDHHLELIKK